MHWLYKQLRIVITVPGDTIATSH